MATTLTPAPPTNACEEPAWRVAPVRPTLIGSATPGTTDTPSGKVTVGTWVPVPTKESPVSTAIRPCFSSTDVTACTSPKPIGGGASVTFFPSRGWCGTAGTCGSVTSISAKSVSTRRRFSASSSSSSGFPSSTTSSLRLGTADMAASELDNHDNVVLQTASALQSLLRKAASGEALLPGKVIPDLANDYFVKDVMPYSMPFSAVDKSSAAQQCKNRFFPLGRYGTARTISRPNLAV